MRFGVPIIWKVIVGFVTGAVAFVFLYANLVFAARSIEFPASCGALFRCSFMADCKVYPRGVLDCCASGCRDYRLQCHLSG